MTAINTKRRRIPVMYEKKTTTHNPTMSAVTVDAV